MKRSKFTLAKKITYTILGVVLALGPRETRRIGIELGKKANMM